MREDHGTVYVMLLAYYDCDANWISYNQKAWFFQVYIVDSRYLEVEGTVWNTAWYPYFDISDVQNWGKYQSNNQIS